MKKILFLLSFTAVLLASCNREAVKEAPVSDELVPVEFTMGGEFSAATRATEVTTSNLNSFYVNATTGSGSENIVSNFQNTVFTKDGNIWKGGKFWPSSNPSYHFYASNSQLTHTTNGATVSPANANTDIVVGYIATPTYQQQNTLVMNHIFAQVGTVKMLAPAGYTVSNLTVSLQPRTSGTYNLKNGSWTSTGNAGSTTYILGTSANSGVSISTAGGSVTSNDNDLWLVPGQYTLTASYTITKGDYSATYSGSSAKTCTVTLVQGANNNIGPVVSGGSEVPNIPEPSDVADISFSVTVTPWTDNPVSAQF